MEKANVWPFPFQPAAYTGLMAVYPVALIVLPAKLPMPWLGPMTPLAAVEPALILDPDAPEPATIMLFE